MLGILDSACTRTFHGSEWGDAYRSFLTDAGLAWEELQTDVAVRGIGGRVQCTRAVKWPVGLYGRPGEILSLEIPNSSTPLLLSRQTQKTLGCVLDFAEELVDLRSLGVYKQKPENAPGGHYALDITAFPPGGHPGLRRGEETYRVDDEQIPPVTTSLPHDDPPPHDDPQDYDDSDYEQAYVTALGNAREEIVDSDEFHPAEGDNETAYALTSKKAAKIQKTCNRLAASND